MITPSFAIVRDDETQLLVTSDLPMVFTDGMKYLVVPFELSKTLDSLDKIFFDSQATEPIEATTMFRDGTPTFRNVVYCDFNIFNIAQMSIVSLSISGEHRIKNISSEEVTSILSSFRITATNYTYEQIGSGSFQSFIEFIENSSRSRRPISQIKIFRNLEFKVESPLRIHPSAFDSTSTPSTSDGFLIESSRAFGTMSLFIAALTTTISNRRSIIDEIKFNTPFYVFSVFMSNIEKEMNDVVVSDMRKVTFSKIVNGFFNLLPLALSSVRSEEIVLIKKKVGTRSLLKGQNQQFVGTNNRQSECFLA